MTKARLTFEIEFEADDTRPTPPRVADWLREFAGQQAVMLETHGPTKNEWYACGDAHVRWTGREDCEDDYERVAARASVIAFLADTIQLGDGCENWLEPARQLGKAVSERMGLPTETVVELFDHGGEVGICIAVVKDGERLRHAARFAGRAWTGFKFTDEEVAQEADGWIDAFRRAWDRTQARKPSAPVDHRSAALARVVKVT